MPPHIRLGVRVHLRVEGRLWLGVEDVLEVQINSGFLCLSFSDWEYSSFITLNDRSNRSDGSETDAVE